MGKLPLVCFDVEVGAAVGYGHLSRSLGLAENILTRFPGCAVWFCGVMDRAAGEMVRKRLPGVCLGADGTIPPGSEPGDCAVTFVDRRYSPVTVVRNHRESGRRVVTVEDLGTGRAEADIVVDPNMSPSVHQRICRLQGGAPARALLGPDYVLLDPRLHEARSSVHAPSGRANRVLLSFGGADPDGVTERVISLLQPVASNISFTVVAGPLVSSARYRSLVRTAGQMTVLRAPCALWKVMSQHDILVTMPGVTLWEAACLGVPTLVTWTRPHQRRMARTFHSRGWTVNLGQAEKLSSTGLCENLMWFASSPKTRSNQHFSSRRAVDGRGQDRLIEMIFGGTL